VRDDVTDVYTIRPFATTTEYQECVSLQEDTWGVGFSERVSPAILKVSQILGGVAAGAYDVHDRLVGFVFGMTGLHDGEVVHWSDMLAVRPEVGNSGLGCRLKLHQREEVLGRGVEKMYWTFDPLQSRNAHLNFSKLGIVVREYEEDMYGQTDSPLHREIGTDRFIALWLLASARVRERLAAGRSDASARSITEAPSALEAKGGGAHPRPGVPDLTLGNERIRVAIPSDIVSLMDDDMPMALQWRAATRAAFTHYLRSGYEVRDFVRGTDSAEYLVVRRSDTEK
jgi:predicted GNAT superfamily acetyltransferase